MSQRRLCKGRSCVLLCWYRLRSRLILDDGTIVTVSLALYSIHTHTRLCSMSHTPRQCGVCLSLFAHSSVWSVAHCRVVLLVGWLAMHGDQDELPNPPRYPRLPVEVPRHLSATIEQIVLGLNMYTGLKIRGGPMLAMNSGFTGGIGHLER